MFRKYRLGFDIGGLALFIMMMLPNLIWSLKPAPNDILRGESVTAAIDTAGSICQALFVVMMCVVVNKSAEKARVTKLKMLTFICAALYFCGWILYYNSVVNAPVILLLTLPPCMAFIFYLLGRKNWIALIPAGIFTYCHLIYGVVNFICC